MTTTVDQSITQESGAPAQSAAIQPATPAPAPMVPSESDSDRAISPFAGDANLRAAWRAAKMLADSSLVPQAYQRNPHNCMIALELANRIGTSVLMTMQHLAIVQGKPTWSAQFLIATVNSCGRFTPIRFRFQGQQGKDEWGCRAVAKDKESGEECVGALITIKIAKDEGWFSRNGSKWKTIPEQMLMYRAAAFWARIYAPELSMGIQTADEVIDTIGEAIPEMPRDVANALIPGSTKALEAAILSQETQSEQPQSADEPPREREPGED